MPEIATLRPCSRAALLTNQVLMPSIVGWSIASMIAGRSASKLVLVDDARRVSGPVEIGDRRGLGRLVIWRAAKFIECQRYRLNILLPSFAHQPDEGVGIHARREEGADRDIGDEVVTHAVQKGFPNLSFDSSFRCSRERPFLRLAVFSRDRIILDWLVQLSLINAHK